MTNEKAGFIDFYWNQHPEGNRPNAKGWLKINGVKYEFAAWPNQNGKADLYAGSVTVPREQPQSQPAPQSQRPADWVR